MKRPNLAALEKACADFNDRCAVGGDVLVRKDNGGLFATRTRSEAQVLSGHTAVIWLDGISGCYLLDRVTPASQVEAVARG